MVGDPDRTVELLWRAGESPAREARQGLSVDRIVESAIRVADSEGLEGLSMRRVAELLGFTTMALYRHVSGRDQLVDLMCDAVTGEAVGADAVKGGADGREAPAGGADGPGAVTGEADGAQGGDGWRAALEAWARSSWALRERHPWLSEAQGTRTVPGPNSIAHFERALSVVAGTGLTPAEMLAVVGLVGRYVDAEARQKVEVARVERRTGVTEEEWWGARHSLYDRLDVYPTLRHIWESGGYDEPEDPFAFGLGRVLDGVEALIRSHCDETRDETDLCRVCGSAIEQPGSGRPRDYCSRACQQRAYRRRRSSQE
ncbi:AcrR family transcriptional regulator [Streptosporangium album]|uniref:AcrR family transcriptional regulator n=1 Tax=Streptosporangium album TaxID=47479 RepID=A0A7W7S4H9_9ACTN|nr:TetR/AcrR family transcriptional regulator [Streptosporangium album]MBB4943759.1 AcrR family transcriptional regulator [Streptosporangium album]